MLFATTSFKMKNYNAQRVLVNKASTRPSNRRLRKIA